MITPEQLAEKHIREHESRLKHIDELVEKVEAVEPKDNDIHDELSSLKQEREKMGDYVADLKQKSPQEFMETAGPMVMWEIVAGKLENLIEKLKKSK